MLAKIAADDKCRRNFRIIFLLELRVKAYLCRFTHFTVEQSKLTVNGSVLTDTPNVRYLPGRTITCQHNPSYTF